MQRIVSLWKLRGRLVSGTGGSVGDPGRLAVRRWRRSQSLAAWSRSDVHRGRRWFDRGWRRRALSARVKPLSRRRWQGLLSVVGWGLVAVHRQRRRGGVGTPPWRGWGRGGGAVLHAGTAGGGGPREVRQGGSLRPRQLWERGSTAVGVILRTRAGCRPRMPRGSSSRTGNL